MATNLVVALRLQQGRYHGRGEPLPSPARIFQALLAGAARGGALDEVSERALRALEELEPPTIGLPTMYPGQRVQMFVPDNDLDGVGGDPARVSDIRSSKVIEPQLFDASVPFIFAWKLPDSEHANEYGAVLTRMAQRVYQFGRGVDMAWGVGEVLDDAELESRLREYPGRVMRPSGGGDGIALPCPRRGTLDSLKARFAASSARFESEGSARGARQLFSQPPKPRFELVAYDSPASRKLYELRGLSNEDRLAVWPLAAASTLVVWLRDAVVTKLRAGLPSQLSTIERVLIGRGPGGSNGGPVEARVRILPLASIGHHHADHGIRRVLVDVPARGPIPGGDVHWAFSGLELYDPDTGEARGIRLIASTDTSMLDHYGVGAHGRARLWRTVTATALPESGRRRRIDPDRRKDEAKGGAERSEEEHRAAAAVVQALRHAGVRTRTESIRVQREPFDAKGARAERFAAGTRFPKERLWHVEIAFTEPVAGPLVIGDGRFLGLGVMAPVRRSQEVYAFEVRAGLAAAARPEDVTRALRRAVMARVQQSLERGAPLPAFFSGHQRDGSPAQSEASPHLTFAFDPERSRLLIIAPNVVDRRLRPERWHLRGLDEAMVDFRELRAGAAGGLTLAPNRIEPESDPLFAPARVWESVTPYVVTRHARNTNAADIMVADIRAECARRGLPQPQVTPRELRGMSGTGLVGGARLKFEAAVRGPIILGKTRHLGGGLFRGSTE